MRLLILYAAAMLLTAIVAYVLGKLVFGGRAYAMYAKASIQSTERKLGPVAGLAATAAFALVVGLAVLPHIGVLLTSFASSVLRRVRRRGYPGPVGVAQVEAAYVLLGPRGLLRRAPLPRATRLQIPQEFGPLKLDTREVVERAHRAGYLVDYWVVNDPDEARKLLSAGATGLMSDNPALLAPVFREFE